MATFIRVGMCVTITCIDAADRAAMIAALVKSGWASADCQFPSLVLDPTSPKAKKLDRIVANITAAGATVPAIKLQATGCLPQGAAWVERRIVQASDDAQRNILRFNNTIAADDGRTLTLTGFGRAFPGREIDGPLWGDAVCFAYYA